MDKTLAKTFCELVAIPSPSGMELDTAEYIRKYLERHRMKPYFDNSGKYNNSNSGNLIVEIPGRGEAVLFTAHMDTVEDGNNKINPIIKGDLIKSDGTTVLGADNKGSVASLLEALAEYRKRKNRRTIIAVFSTREEQGSMGIEFLKLKERIKFAFVLDGLETHECFIVKTLGQTPFTIELYGLESHSAFAPEKGINAISAAALIISKLKQGRDERGGTLNIGSISGGGAINVVPDYARIDGEVRGYTERQIDDKLRYVEEAVVGVCRKTKVRFRFSRNDEEGSLPFKVKSKSIINFAERGARSAGLNLDFVSLSACTEAGFLSRMGYNVLGISMGGRFPHSKDESISIKTMYKLKELLLKLME